MADLTYTFTGVVAVSGTPALGTCSQTILAGQNVFKDASNSDKLTLTDADSAGKNLMDGMALCNGSVNQTISYLPNGGTITLPTANMTVGAVYIASANAGMTGPHSDIASGMNVTLVGYPLTSANLKILGTPTSTSRP